MVAVKDNSPRFTAEEYFAWEEQQLEKHEYLGGEVYAMTGGTVNHSRIALKFGALLDNHLSGSACQAANSDCRVNIEIDLYRKTESGSWEIINYQTGDTIELKSVNLTFPIERIYEGISLTLSAEGS